MESGRPSGPPFVLDCLSRVPAAALVVESPTPEPGRNVLHWKQHNAILALPCDSLVCSSGWPLGVHTDRSSKSPRSGPPRRLMAQRWAAAAAPEPAIQGYSSAPTKPSQISWRSLIGSIFPSFLRRLG